jgi:hypothetical protein
MLFIYGVYQVIKGVYQIFTKDNHWNPAVGAAGPGRRRNPAPARAVDNPALETLDSFG